MHTPTIAEVTAIQSRWETLLILEGHDITLIRTARSAEMSDDEKRAALRTWWQQMHDALLDYATARISDGLRAASTGNVAGALTLKAEANEARQAARTLRGEAA